MQTIRQDAEGFAEYIIQKSRFLAYTKRVNEESEAQEFIMRIKKKHYDARHNPSAYVLGEHGERQKSNDDGEPGGTAGNPILESIKKKGLTNTVVVVTRYFGGIKLGAGGLIRAYGHSAILGLEATPIVERRPYTRLAVALPYDLLASVENYVRETSLKREETEYADGVTLRLLAEPAALERVKADITDLTAARAIFEDGDTTVLELPIT
ncbi:YigZ family protein [Selenomonas sp. TAMA-11512]|uniref:YigZ family protein n=1 Tax=Selenomonas sp. TAMA-11512 TaxID=3095337 RepID=UPI0030D51829